MPTQKNLLTLGLASVGMVASSSPSHAASQATNDIKEVTITTETAATRILITGSKSFTPEVKSLGKTGVTTITLPGIWQAGRAGSKSIQKNGIAFVRYGQFSMRPNKQVRIVANYNSKFSKGLQYELIPSEDKTCWEVVLYAPGSEVAARASSETRASKLPSILAAAPKKPTVFVEALAVDKDPIPGISVRRQRTGISVDIRALTRAASRVASSGAFAPMGEAGLATYSLATAPQLSLATALPMAPRVRPLAVIATMGAKLTPYPTRGSEPPVVAPLLPALERPASRALPSAPSQKKAVLIPVKAPKVSAPTVAADSAPTELPLTPIEPRPTPPAPRAATPQENALDRIVSLDFVNSELADVLKLISLQAKANVVSGQSVIGKKVTLSLQKVLLRDALDWITRTSGVSYTMEGTNTIIVGTGQEIALLKRTNQTPEAASANIPFFYADSDSLKTALSAAFPNVTIFVIKASEESKKPEENTQQQTQAAATGERVATGGTGSVNPSSMATIRPRGGSLYVVSTRSIIEELRRTIEDMEHGLIEIAQRDADRKAEQLRAYVTETYEVKYVDPTQTAKLVLESVPNIILRPGPSQRFIASPVGLGGALSQSGGGSQSANSSQSGGASPSGSGGQSASGGGSNLIESRVLMITGKASDVARAKEMLNQLDIKVPQFIYEARLVEVNKDDVSQLGLTVDLGRAIQIGENDKGGQPNTSVNAVDGGRKLNGGSIFRTPYSVATQIDALATKGKANILARPTLSALDGNSAVTFIGDQVPYVISQSISPTGGLNVVTGVANAGIRLQVSGRSNGDGTMTIYVHPEISSITQFVGGLPQISTRFVDTTIRVKNGETIAIGGLVQKQEIDNMRKVPGLGDLPILGQLFRSSDKRTKESEVLIFITCSLAKD